MRFVRVASMYFEPPPSGWSSWQCRFGQVTVGTLPIGQAPPAEGKLRVIVTAEISIPPPEVDEEGFLALPEQARRQCETALEEVANIIAVFGRCRRSISSASPCAALIVDDASERVFLDKTRGFHAKRSMLTGHHYQIPVSDDMVARLKDRLDGVALLAEAYSHTKEAGRFHEFVRFFEAAFALPFSQLDKKLAQFLNSAYGYTRSEINGWVRMRDPMTHADGKKADRIMVDADVRRVTHRMEQAALDVLFNKETWRDRSRSRRTLWRPIAATTSPEGGLILREGSTPSLTFQLFDEFGVFPLDLHAVLVKPPDSWWYRFEAPDHEARANQAMKPPA